MLEQERVRKEKPGNPNLLYCDRIGSAVQALIGMGRAETDHGYRIEDKIGGRKVGNRSFQQHAIEVKMSPSSDVEFTRAVMFELILPKNARFKKDEKVIINGCLLQGIDEKGKIVSIGFTTHVLGTTGQYAGTLYAVQREGKEPVQWAEGTPSPLHISEQQRVAKAVGLPIF